MANYTEFYVKTTGSDLNSGSDQNDSSSFTYAGGNWVQSTRIFTLAAGNPITDGVAVGMFASVYATGATQAAFMARVTTVTATTIGLNTGFGTIPTDGTGDRELKIGGAWQTFNYALTFPGNNQSATNSNSDPPRINFLAGTWNVTSATSRSAQSALVFKGAGIDQTIIDGGTSGASYTILTLSSNGTRIEDMTFRNNGATGTSTGVVLSGSNSSFARVRVTGMRGHGFQNASATCYDIETDNNNLSNNNATGGLYSTGGVFIRCVSHDNQGSNSNGIIIAGRTRLIDCIFDSNGAWGIRQSAESSSDVIGCDITNNPSGGFYISVLTGANQWRLEKTNFISNGRYGVEAIGTGSGLSNSILIIENGCGFYNNPLGELSPRVIPCVESTARIVYNSSPYINVAPSSLGMPRAGNFAVLPNSGAVDSWIVSFVQNSGYYNIKSSGYSNPGAIDRREFRQIASSV